MPMAHWRSESVDFDKLYERSWEHRIPYFGRLIRRGLERRENGALDYARPLEGKTLIDLGCGVGRFAMLAASRGARVFGYDISPGAIAAAREKAERMGLSKKVSFEVADIAAVDYPEADIWFDMGCLQYIGPIRPVLERLRHVPLFFSELPRKGHPLNIPRLAYRKLLKGNPYRTYTKKEIREVFSVLGNVGIEARGLAWWITAGVGVPCSLDHPRG